MSGAAGAAAAGAAAIQAIKASGALVRVAPDDFKKLLDQNARGLVVHKAGGFLTTAHTYLMGYQGLAFYTKSGEELRVPSTCQLVQASKIWLP